MTVLSKILFVLNVSWLPILYVSLNQNKGPEHVCISSIEVLIRALNDLNVAKAS